MFSGLNGFVFALRLCMDGIPQLKHLIDVPPSYCCSNLNNIMRVHIAPAASIAINLDSVCERAINAA